MRNGGKVRMTKREKEEEREEEKEEEEEEEEEREEEKREEEEGGYGEKGGKAIVSQKTGKSWPHLMEVSGWRLLVPAPPTPTPTPRAATC